MFNNLRHRTEREENYKDMDLKSSKRGFHRSPGTNSSVVKGNETRLVRCVHCGFPCDRERDSRADEESWAFLGINYGSQNTASPSIGDAGFGNGAWGSSGWGSASWSGDKGPDNYYERKVLGGCPCCGSFLYDKKPMESE